jgi:hypothetical protein
MTLLQNDSGNWLSAQGLATDGRWVLTLRQGRDWSVCFDGGDRTQVGLENKPAELLDAAGHSWAGWEWSAGTLTLHRPSQGNAVCLMMTE